MIHFDTWMEKARLHDPIAGISLSILSIPNRNRCPTFLGFLPSPKISIYLNLPIFLNPSGLPFIVFVFDNFFDAPLKSPMIDPLLLPIKEDNILD